MEIEALVHLCCVGLCGLGLPVKENQPHLCWEYSGRPAEASRRWKAARLWRTRKDTRQAPTSPPWSLGKEKPHVIQLLASNAALYPVIPVSECTKCTAVAEAGTELDWGGWRDSTSGNKLHIPSFTRGKTLKRNIWNCLSMFTLIFVSRIVLLEKQLCFTRISIYDYHYLNLLLSWAKE